MGGDCQNVSNSPKPKVRMSKPILKAEDASRMKKMYRMSQILSFLLGSNMVGFASE